MYQYVNTEQQHLAWSIAEQEWVIRQRATVFQASERWTATVPVGGVFKRFKSYR